MKKIILLLCVVLSFVSLRSQNVGVGTTTPQSKLDVSGSVGTAIQTISSATTLDGTYSTILATPSSAYTITLPAVATAARRVYTIVYNATAGGNTITIKANGAENITNGGSTANTLALTGGSIVLQSDGTKWFTTTSATTTGTVTSVAATAPLSSSGGATPNISLTGIVPIANGGTNSGTALSGSSIMTSNGSSIVQGPAGTTTTVLHGNAAGAPAYGSVALTTDVSGVLPVANGGTGSNTQNYVDLTTAQTAAGVKTWSGNGIFNSSVGVGVTPNDKFDVLASGGKDVLIGGGATTGSEVKLTNSGTAHFSMYNSGNSKLTFANTSTLLGTNVAGTPLMTLDASGNMVVTGTISSSGGLSGSGTANYLARWTGANTLSTGVTYDNGTNVGIGSTTPGQRLTIVDAGNSNQYSGTFSVFANNLSQGVGIGYMGIQALGSNANQDLAINSRGTGNVYFQNTGTTGNVGIGNSAPGAKLDVTGPATGSGVTVKVGGGGDLMLASGGTLFFDGNYSYAGGNYIRPVAANTQSFVTSGVEAMRITSSGSVGIGTGSPSFKLHVPSGYIGTDYINTSDNSVGSGVTGVMVKQGDNYHRTATAAALTTFLNTGNGFIQNQYSAAQTASLWISGAAQATEIYNNGWFRSNNGSTGWYSQPYASGIYSTTTGEVATYNGSYFRITGAGNGSGNLRFDAANPYIYASSYIVMPGGLYVNGGTHYDQNQYQCRGGIHNDNASYLEVDGGTSAYTYVNGSLGIGTTAPGKSLEVIGDISLPSSSGNKAIYTWSPGDGNWRIGMSATPPFSRSLCTSHVEYLTYANGAGQGFAVGDVVSGLSSFEVGSSGSSYQAYLRGSLGINATPNNNNKLLSILSATTGAGSDYKYGATYSGMTGYVPNSGRGYPSANMYQYGVVGQKDVNYDGAYYWDYRSGGVLGTLFYSGSAYTYNSWGSLGYLTSGAGNYGLYYVSSSSGSGYLPSTKATGIGAGGVGEFIGSWTRGGVIGHMAAGELAAGYNVGNVYTSGHNVEIVNNGEKRTAAYSITSSEATVVKAGKGQLTAGKASVTFDPKFAALLSAEEEPVVTITAIGASNGIYLASVSKDGFEVAENNNGNSNVAFNYTVVGKRVDASSASMPADFEAKNFDENLKGFMFNENNKEQSAKPMWWDGSKIRWDAIPKGGSGK